MNLDEKRETKSLINYTHMVSRNTSQEEIACGLLNVPRAGGWFVQGLMQLDFGCFVACI